ncbi:MAG: single-stranded DNA-binding protein [Acidobacteriota bacterium]|nr:MAG: single-stranded DNA-binding protein [Acidobacteriota bacterium]
MSFNKITIVGYLGRDPELKYTPQGTPVCKISIATTERRKNAAGQSEEHTTWFRVTIWGRQAELAKEYLSRGRQVYVEGRLRLEEYTDRDGVVRISPEVTAQDIQFLGQRGEVTAPVHGTEVNDAKTEPAETEARAPRQKTSRKKSSSAEKLVSIEEDGIPF